MEPHPWVPLVVRCRFERLHSRAGSRQSGEISTDEQVYSQALADRLKSQGATPAAIHITRVLQLDLEGDGVKEGLISASYFASTVMPVSQVGDYSVILLRKVVGNDGVTIPIMEDFYISSAAQATYPNTYFLVDVIDLNQDGKLEIVAGITRWEGLGWQFTQFQTVQLRQCGKHSALDRDSQCETALKMPSGCRDLADGVSHFCRGRRKKYRKNPTFL